ncbi:ABC transporter substrate-binding protein [Streptomyces sp. WMMB 322]|uniref:ABC transporter substrate-binding protein n=1 Tax=Streptomyces sp. WMMB 322 TaxID=1286821 RepID=UPI0006E1D4F6|nr:extracellular solute-binding protein [Streptomyces sp. WMMB 322]SCK18684.1 carbohydrate ABC transporter substrate-binding protein, CUT1 family (TC 3.A.1.1.-) [Streptomyces sp. WMMB 322]
MAVHTSRRSVLGAGLGGAAAALLSACGGASTTGAGNGALSFLSTQFSPVEEKQRFKAILKNRVKGTPVAFTAVEAGDFATTLTAQLKAKKLSVSLIGGLHGDLAPYADQLTDTDDLLGELSGARIPQRLTDIAAFGGSKPKYVPWMQTSYVLAVNKKALQWLPEGADVQNLTYDQFLDWMTAGKRGAGRPIFGMPAGPNGLYHRFFQGFLLPSFTGGQVVPFRSPDAVQAWKYMKDLWSVSAPASTNYAYMQEPLARGEVLVAWDHLARLLGAPAKNPDEWQMVPAPRGPKGLGFMLVVAGLGILKGAPRQDDARKVIKALCTPGAQGDVLKKNGFAPTVGGRMPTGLPAAIALGADAFSRQQDAEDAITALPPVGVGAKDGEISEAFKECFTQICLKDKPIQPVLDAQAKKLNSLLAEVKAECWAPDEAAEGKTCRVA